MIRQLIEARASQNPEAPAILAPAGEALSYRGLEAALDRFTAALDHLALESSDRIALVCSNGPLAASAFLGIAGYAACAPLNPGYRASEFEFYLSDLRPRVLVIEQSLDSAARQAAVERGIPVFELTPDLDLVGSVLPLPAMRQDRDDIALLLHTSGTTSRPKLIQLTRENLRTSAHNIARSLCLTEADRCLNVMPLFHVHGLVGALLSTIASGGSIVCGPGFVAPKFLDWVEEFRPTWYTAVPTIHQSVLARAGGIRSHSLRFIRSCSAALAPSLMEEMERVFGVPVIEAYGMTEAAHQMASNPLPPGRRKAGSVGIAAGSEIAILDGEVAVRGANVFPAGLNDGWFRTGDRGYLDDDGYLFLTGRSKEMINRGGEKIAPREIDEILLLHPAVEQAVVFAAPHRSLGEAVAAAVALRPGHSVTERALREFAAEHLADFKVPERILFLEEIPKGPTGKIQRIGLAAKLGITEIRPDRAAVKFIAPRTRTEAKVEAIFAATLGARRAGLDDNFFDSGGDSLLLSALLSRLRAATGAEISLIAFLQDPTIRGVCKELEPASQSSQLHLIVRPGDSPALFCIPGSHGNLVGFFGLARSLGPGIPVTAFQLPAVPSRPAAYTIEALAARYVDEIRTLQPAGPYHLAGACTGGFVAYEIAQQLRAQGQPVGVLALMDCFNHSPWSRSEKLKYGLRLLKKRWDYHRAGLRKSGWAGMEAYLQPRSAAFFGGVRERAEENAYLWLRSIGSPLPAGLRDPRLAIRHAASRYHPAHWPGPLDLFAVEEPRAEGYDYPEMGWQGLAQSISVHSLPGGHMAMLSEPAVLVLADQLRASVLGAAPCRAGAAFPLGAGTA